MVQVKILTPFPAPAITADRFGKQDMVIQYLLDSKGPYEVRVPLESYTPEEGEKAVREQAKKQTALANKEFSI